VRVHTSVEEVPGTHDLASGLYVSLRVEDEGCGMAPETVSRIFEPFFTTKFTGRGLGLAAVQGIVRSHKGNLHVESSVGKGSVFTVLLPACTNRGA
jgi:two-component system, cell cycle sensor histidine kinase and response regulator CckA